MPTEREVIQDYKAMAYDIIRILKRNPEKQTYTREEIEQLLDTYVQSFESQKT